MTVYEDRGNLTHLRRIQSIHTGPDTGTALPTWYVLNRKLDVYQILAKATVRIQFRKIKLEKKHLYCKDTLSHQIAGQQMIFFTCSPPPIFFRNTGINIFRKARLYLQLSRPDQGFYGKGSSPASMWLKIGQTLLVLWTCRHALLVSRLLSLKG